MKFSMARNTNRNNIQPMFFGIAWMMILLRRFRTIMALQNIGIRQLAKFNSIIHGAFCFFSFRILFYIRAQSSFPFLALVIVLNCSFAFFAISIALYSFMMNLASLFCFAVSSSLLVKTHLTLIMMTIFVCAILVKFRNWFNLFAFRAVFCYDCLRHGFSPFQKSCVLSRLQANPVFGSFYFITNRGIVQ